MADWYVSSAAWTAIPQFAASGAYTVGQIVRPLTAPAFNAQYTFRCTTAGTAATEPAWPAGNNATVTTGGATFTNVAGQSAYGWSAAAGNLFCLGLNGASSRIAVGDRLFLSSDHSESSGSGYNLTGASAYGVIQVISVNRAGSVPPAAVDALSGATIAYNSGNWTLDCYSNIYWQGITFSYTGPNNIILANAGTKGHYFRNCAINLGSTANVTLTSQASCGAVLDNTTIQFGTASQHISVGGTGFCFDLKWVNTPSAILGTAPTTLFTGGSGGNVSTAVFRGVDLSAVTGTLVYYGSMTYSKYLFDSCRIATGVARLGSTAYANAIDEIELVNCFDGSNIINERHTPAGDITTNRSTTMVGGAQDDVGLFSHQMVSSTRADMMTMTLDSFWMDVEQSAIGAAHTATVEIISSATLNTTDISLVLEYQGTSGSSLAAFTSTLSNALTASAALPTSTATWNGGSGVNTLDPAFNTANITLSNSNLTLTNRTASAFYPARATVSAAAGKYYFEATCNTSNGTGTQVGVVNQRFTGSNTFIGGDTNSNGYQSSGSIDGNGGTVASILSWTTGDVICVAFDIANQKIWYRKNGGSWDNTTDNPTTNVGGFNLANPLSSGGVIYPAVCCYSAGDQMTINLGGTAFAQAVPSGFTALPAGITQHLQASFTPQTAGRVRGIVRLGKPSTTVYVNPQIIVT